MSSKKQTAMQDLKKDLILAKINSIKFLNIINDEHKRVVCQNVCSLLIDEIIRRIDSELLELEKKQITDAWLSAWKDSMLNPLEDKYYMQDAEQYYRDTYETDNQ